jgi:hypothetical protein
MNKDFTGMRIFLGSVALLAMATTCVWGQFVGGGLSQQKTGRTDAVEYLYPEQVTVPAGRPYKLTLHFRVAPGLHINSHTPHDEFLIPTVFSIPGSKQVRMLSINYPAGVDATLSTNPKEKLNVYTNEFILDTQIVAEPGNHLVEGKLHYQACDEHECMPPKTIPVTIDIIGK